jgi:hypothetical protein
VPTRLQELLSPWLHDLWSAWARRRYRGDFQRVTAFCLFVGYPRSGHSIVGALLNAHRDAVIAHEANAAQRILDGCRRDELYAAILARAYWFNLRGNVGVYPYQVPNQWQGRFASLRVIGDKRGGLVSRSLEAHPDFLERMRTLVGVPLRLVHVVRHPLDNISAISIGNQLSLEESIEFYFRHCRATARLGVLCDPDEVFTLHHEEMIAAPAKSLSDLCAFLGLEPYPGYLEDCGRVIFRAPMLTRRKVAWTASLVRRVEEQARPCAFLDAYGYEIPDRRTAAERRVDTQRFSATTATK